MFEFDLILATLVNIDKATQAIEVVALWRTIAPLGDKQILNSENNGHKLPAKQK